MNPFDPFNLWHLSGMGTLRYVTLALPTATVTNLLVAHQNMDDKTVYSILKAMFDHRDDLIRVHKEAANIKLENQKTEASSIPWHPGAIKYFAEKGIKIH